MTSRISVEEIRARLQPYIDTWSSQTLDTMGETVEWAKFRNFAVETVLREYDLANDEIADACAYDGQRDKGIDALWLDSSAEPPVLHLFQSKDTRPTREDWSKMADGVLDLFEEGRPQAANRFLREWSSSFFADHPDNFSVTCHLVTSARTSLTVYEEERRFLGQNRLFLYQKHDIDDLLEAWNRSVRSVDPIDVRLSVQEGQFFQVDELHLNRRMISALIPAKDLASIFREHGRNLFRLNPRYFLTLRSPNNAAISESILTDPERFHLLNNGITATGTGVMVEGGFGGIRMAGDSSPERTISVRDFQIVNGCQTTAVIDRVSNGGVAGRQAVARAYVLVRIVEDSTADYYQQVSKASNTQTPLKASDWRSFENVHKTLREQFNRLPESYFYEYWRGEWNADYSDAHSREPYEIQSAPRTYRMFTTETIAQHGWAFLGSGYRSAEMGRRVMENDDIFNRVFPEDTIHAYQLLLAYRIGEIAHEILRNRALSENRAPGLYSALKFPTITLSAKALAQFHESDEGEYLTVATSESLLSTIGEWCPKLCAVIANSLIIYLNRNMANDPTRGYRSFVRQGNWIDGAWPEIASQINNLPSVGTDLVAYMPSATQQTLTYEFS